MDLNTNDLLQCHDDDFSAALTIGLRQGKRHIFVSSLVSGDTFRGYGVIDAPDGKRGVAHNIRFGVTGGKLRGTFLEAAQDLVNFGVRHNLQAVYMTNDIRECGLLTEGQTAQESVKQFIENLYQSDPAGATQLYRTLSDSVKRIRDKRLDNEAKAKAKEGTIYLVHFDEPHHNRNHYLGYIPFAGNTPAKSLILNGYADDKLTDLVNNVLLDKWSIGYEMHGTLEDFEAMKGRKYSSICSVCKERKHG